MNVHVDDAAAFGHYLQATRERQRITLELVSHRTKIAPRLLAGLERGDISAWPPGIYRRAMMRAYAEAIGLDREFAMDQFGRLFERTAEPATDPARPAEAPARARRRAAPSHDSASWLLQAAQLAGAATVVAIIVSAVAFIVRRVPPEGPVVHAQADPVPPAPLRAVMPLAVPPAPKPEAVVAPAGSLAVQEPEPAATEGLLTIASEPAGAVVTVNGIRRGVTPLTIDDVPLGEKRVRLILDGYVSEERIAVLSAERAAAAIEVKLLPRGTAESGRADRRARTPDRDPRISRSPLDRTARDGAGRRTAGSRPSRRSASAP